MAETFVLINQEWQSRPSQVVNNETNAKWNGVAIYIPVHEHPHCANDVWDLYQNKDQYWCCEQGLIGYFDNKANGFGCVDGNPNGTDVTLATPISNVDQSPSSTTIVTATVTPKSDPEGDSPLPSSSTKSTDTGVIAGSTVGSVAGFTLILTCIWFLVRRRKQQASSAELEAKTMKQSVPIAELHSDVARAELDSGAAAAHELPAR
ncbi:hypothetical protein P168DRAFT_280642 [Aspergillus campestris IBT 28561]|uniref:WSC domain-containing protein n=1 Tax=Aspergillus campestris (strain IBT 28561) TaxID=1392248 RepID=A0A2I1D797_ASPC2|nr:uncharacterized protein P168DRAFT_280642 [Aspergillus campestris IBT 28561]PKY05756.1 hypothetical protein P168DRAFT_280642 [Aspergillus campestris IBT 28561]